MKIIVNDANILIDLVELQLLPNFFSLDYEFYTTVLVFEELEDDQQETLQEFITSGALIIRELTTEQLTEINDIQRKKPALSPQDCSAFYQAQTEVGILVTSDNKLRKFAKENKLEVHGHLWVFDRMYEARTITAQLAIEKLNELCDTVNQHLGLPAKECSNRIQLWSEGL